MKKVYLMMLLTIASYVDINAQSYAWSQKGGLWAYDYGNGIVNDAAGNVYVAGKYELDAVFGSTTFSCEGNHDLYLIKYSPTGTIVWTRTAGGANGDYAHALAIDNSGNLITVGEVEGYGNTITFQGSSITVSPVGDNDILVAKYDPNGTLLWARTQGYLHGEKAKGVACDASGNIYVSGYFTDTTVIGGTTIMNAGYNDMFLMKYDPNGNFQWVRTGGGPGREEGLAVTVDAAGDVYVCGMHHDDAVFGSTTLNAPLGNYNIFLAKYNSAGTLVWIESPGSDYDDLAFGLTTDNAGRILMTGEFTGYCMFDSHALINSSMLSDGFVACYDASGNAQWVTQISGTLADRPRAIASDGVNTFITGQFGGTSVFGSATLVAADSSDIFIAGLNSAGAFIWATAVGGTADSLETLGYESGNAISATAAGAVYATGALLNGGTFGSTNLTQYGRTDVFVTRINQAGVGTDDFTKNSISLYPNPNSGSFTLDLSSLTQSENLLNIYNYLGQVVESKVVTSARTELQLTEKGVYFVKVASGTRNYMTKIVVQ